VDAAHDGEAHAIRLRGVASFFHLPRLSEILEQSPPTGAVELDVTDLEAIDHTSAEMVRDWYKRRRSAGFEVSIKGAGGRLPALTA